MKLKFGKYKNAEMSDASVPTDYLFWLIKNTDTNDPKWGAQNRALVDEANRVINARTDSEQRAGRAGLIKTAPREPQKPAATFTKSHQREQAIADLRDYIQDVYDAAAKAREAVDEVLNGENASGDPF